MKRVRINAHQTGLVFKRGAYQHMLTTGSYWLMPFETLEIYDMTQAFNATHQWNILLQDNVLRDRLHVIEVKDHEIVLQYEDGLLKKVLTAGRYAFWKGIINYTFTRADIGKAVITEPIDRTTLLNKQLAPFIRTFSVEHYEKAILLIDGKYAQTLASGIYYFWKNDIPVFVGKIDTRQLQVELNGQEILTKDKASLRINAWAQYRITDIEQALLQNKEHERQLYVIFQLTLREYIAGFDFDELLEKKDALAAYVLEAVKEKAAQLGIAVAGFGIRDIILPGDMKEIMNQVLMAEKKAQANIITRREETASTRSLLNTAKLMEDNSMLFKLKEMEYVEKIAERVNNISLNGNGVLIDQLRQIFVPVK
ncbi:slipin family protein [Chitinophaga agrisoli]|uniref:Slipin family protein n=1 Tax=Chitinophaga agrisoli TaxID=2607653 RepID=A0A5B2W203_9BACT|nr:slipin family protein [Chitinophaga agrisoli]KAA2244800.1 slipin family protein [Chitinophaga agrisoli]